MMSIADQHLIMEIKAIFLLDFENNDVTCKQKRKQNGIRVNNNLFGRCQRNS
jgi:hypothetical protein